MRLTIFILMTSVVTTLNAQDKEPTNKHFWYSLETSASLEVIWAVWTDIPNWKNWDTGLKDASIKGYFDLDSKGVIISLEDRKSKFKVIEYTDGQSYPYKTKLPLGSLYVKRYLTVREGKTIFTHEVWFKELTGGIFAKAFGKKFRTMLPDVMTQIKEIAESK